MITILEKAKLLTSAVNGSQEFFKLYDELLWVIVTATSHDLNLASDKLYQPPLLDIPRTLQVALLRLAVLSEVNEASRERQLDLLASLCDPFEETDIVTPLRKSR